eukprot:c15604_g1_i1.p1 GENE.c15604_g1_i1~~c15604_g1_i1.p1  ORF type:complete len:287 (+),score=111.75 c15604_g1_i1:64-924(+)
MATKIIQNDAELYNNLKGLLTKKIVIFVGQPGVGKSFVTNGMAEMAVQANKKVQTLLWDVSGAAFKYACPDQQLVSGNSEHELVVRASAGQWARAKISKWFAEHGNDENQVLIGEAPFVDGRFIELVRSYDDQAEGILKDVNITSFVVVTPSLEVRESIVKLREERMKNPLHPNEKEDCPVSLIKEFWNVLHAAAVERKITNEHVESNSPPFDPKVYEEMYKALCKRRPVSVVHMAKVLDTSSFTPYNFESSVTQATPTNEEVAEFLEIGKKLFDKDIQKTWFRDD